MRLLIPVGLLLLSFSALPSTAQTERTCTPVGGLCSSSSDCCYNPVVSCSRSGTDEGRSCLLPNFTNVSPGTAAVIRMALTFIITALNQFIGQVVPGLTSNSNILQYLPIPLSSS